jgi:hypothetical protein
VLALPLTAMSAPPAQDDRPLEARAPLAAADLSAAAPRASTPLDALAWAASFDFGLRFVGASLPFGAVLLGAALLPGGGGAVPILPILMGVVASGLVIGVFPALQAGLFRAIVDSPTTKHRFEPLLAVAYLTDIAAAVIAVFGAPLWGPAIAVYAVGSAIGSLAMAVTAVRTAQPAVAAAPPPSGGSVSVLTFDF